MTKIDDYNNTLEKAGAINENFITWPVLGVYIWPNEFVGTTHFSEIDYMKNWIKDRLSWMDKAIGNL